MLTEMDGELVNYQAVNLLSQNWWRTPSIYQTLLVNGWRLSRCLVLLFAEADRELVNYQV